METEILKYFPACVFRGKRAGPLNSTRYFPESSYGRISLTGTPEMFNRELKQRHVKADLRVMKIGETIKLSE